MYVVNNEVKMQWLKSGWYQRKSRGKTPGAFVFASQTYPSAKGEDITVFFTATTAFLIVSDEGAWNAKEFLSAVRDDIGGSFPYDLEEYVPVIESGEEFCKDFVLEEWGIMDAKADIEARLRDIAPYGEERDFKDF